MPSVLFSSNEDAMSFSLFNVHCSGALLYMKNLILELQTKVMIILIYRNSGNRPHCAVNTTKSTTNLTACIDSLLTTCGVVGSIRFE